MKTLVSFSVAIALIMISPMSVLASEPVPQDLYSSRLLQDTPSLTSSQISELNDWVLYEAESNRYAIRDGAKDSLSSADYQLLFQCISITNANLSNADFSSGEVVVDTPSAAKDGVRPLRASSRFKEGTTKLVFHWWGVTVYLSKSTIQTAAAGVSIAGIWIPGPVISKVVATMGVLATLCPGGIAFDYNFIIAGIQILAPGTMMIPLAVSNVRWQ